MGIELKTIFVLFNERLTNDGNFVDHYIGRHWPECSVVSGSQQRAITGQCHQEKTINQRCDIDWSREKALLKRVNLDEPSVFERMRWRLNQE